MDDPEFSTTASSTAGPHLKLGAVADRYGVSPATVKRWERNDPSFPRGVQLSPRVRVYVAAEVDEFLKRKAAE